MEAVQDDRSVAAVNVLLVDDHLCFGQSVARALSAEPDLAVSNCTSMSAALEILQRQHIDVVLLDHADRAIVASVQSRDCRRRRRQRRYRR